MQTTPSTPSTPSTREIPRPATPHGTPHGTGAARPPAAVPPGRVIPLVTAGLPAWRPNPGTAGLALGVGLFLGVGAILTPDTGDHLASGDPALIASTVAELVALAALVIAGAAAVLSRKGART
ncbi:hypothetical protein [Streptomyces sp. SID13726]|uniref:hypothetical protein n=1 Tax=Streptomyces sp. SID13726 TaxID=2706058 RepID=UPI0013B7A6A5|nr:hypothetical protein [Streptomyces sp. SID13726]NEA97496.1 hypothetical protein [Streptomyces sp. SID13726]